MIRLDRLFKESSIVSVYCTSTTLKILPCNPFKIGVNVKEQTLIKTCDFSKKNFVL